MGFLRNATVPGLVVACASGVGLAQATLPLDGGDVVATCHSGYPYNASNPNGFTVVVYDATDPVGQGAPLDANWQPPVTHNETAAPEHVWNVRNMGEVYGVTLDDALSPNIYVTATTVYGQFPPGPGGSGAIYRIDGASGNVSVFATVPNNGPALGNISFDELHDQFYVSNHDDGLIYRIDMTGTVQSTYDHGVDGRPNEALAPIDDDPTREFTQLGRRVWGLEESNGRLYYAVWWEDLGCRTAYSLFDPTRGCPDVTTVANEIWSVAINPTTGDFVANSAMLEISIPGQDDGNGGIEDNVVSSPVSDIDFSANGNMILGARSMLDDVGRGQIPYHPGSPWDAHRARVLEYQGSSGSWTGQPINTWRVGGRDGGGSQLHWNSAGGVSWDCDENLWMSGDYLHFNAPTNVGRYIYGLQFTPMGGNATAAPRATSTSYLIDLDNNTNGAGQVHKTQVGDVVVYDPSCSCAMVETKRLDCPMTADDDSLSWLFNVTNNSGQTAEHIFLTPISGGGFADQTIDIPTLLDGESSGPIKADIVGATPGGRFCFLVTLMTGDLEECCTVEVCLDIPDCVCMQVLEQSIECDPNNPGKYIYTATIKNLSDEDVYHVYLLPPDGVMMMDDYFDFSANPIPAYGTFQIQTQIMGATPGEVLCFLISLHNAGLEECCSEKVEITVPICDDGIIKDRCDTTQIAMCCPPQNVATITATICNDGSSPHSYSWSIDGLPPSGSCNIQLLPGAFSPQSGTVGPIAPGSCATLTITVNCADLFDGLPMTCSNYGITFTNLTNGDELLCTGIVKRSDMVIVKEATPGPVDVPVGAQATLSYTVENAGVEPVAGTLTIDDINPDGDYDGNWLSLDGQEGGAPATAQFDLPPQGSTMISVNVRWTYGAPGQTDQLYVTMPDMDGDGQAELLAASTVRLVDPGARCLGDANGDNVVDFTDLNAVLAQFGADGSGLFGDVNGDGVVDFSDLNEVLSTFGNVCD